MSTTSRPNVAGAALAADLGTIKRTDGTTQVTYHGHPLYSYHGHPLYYYAKRGDAGDAYGQGLKSFGAPSGNKVDQS